MTTHKPERSEFDSVDPAPASEDSRVDSLRVTICDEDEKMFQRMRALFALRNIGGEDAVEALAAAFESKSALLKHEIAYVMGQMQDSHAVPHLIDRLADLDEENVSIATRARSYIYSNCAQCHVGAGGGNSQMHFEWNKSLAEMKIVGEQPLHGLKGIADGKLIVPGAPERSVLLHRMNTRGTGQMPIIATHSVHEQAVDVIGQWIRGMEIKE